MTIPDSIDYNPGEQARVNFLLVIRLFKTHPYLTGFRHLLGKVRNILLMFLRNVLRIPTMQAVIKEKNFLLT